MVLLLKIGEVAQNSLHTMGGSSSLAAMWPHPCWGWPQLLLAQTPPSLALGTSRDEAAALGSLSQCLSTLRGKGFFCVSGNASESRAQLPWGQWHCQSLWITQITCWDSLRCHPEYLCQVFNRHQGATVFNWFWFELPSENGNFYMPLAAPWTAKTSWSPYVILSFVIQANCSKPNWVQPSSPGALFGPAKGHFSSTFKPCSTSTAQKIKPHIPYRKKDQRMKSAFSALHRFAAFIQIQPSGCDSSLQLWEMLLFVLQATRGDATQLTFVPWPCLPLPARGDSTSSNPAPGSGSKGSHLQKQTLLSPAYKDTKVPLWV